ncbi:hypothetical protein Lal_00024715 [Lupinus albus]|nr:hypothetical protein Lal_00024715 [Lupinus albus]
MGGFVRVALDTDANISSLGEWRNGVWCWNLQWRRSLFICEQGEVEALLKILEDARLRQEHNDGWLWIHDKEGHYSVRNAYQVLLKAENNGDNEFFKSMWRCNVPTKMRCFVWRMSFDGVPTRLNLVRREVLDVHVL